MELEMVDEDGEVVDAIIMEVTPDEVVVDFNPPLAGKTLHYSVEVVDVRDATDEELEMGLPASLIDEMFEDVDLDEED
jgi:FKBP-type peptidyl-prolyl cis-trans isomerase SlyD